MEFDFNKLKGRMREKKVTQEEAANFLGVGKSTLNLKLNNQFSFTQEEINKLSELLDIPTEEIGIYFFTTIV